MRILLRKIKNFFLYIYKQIQWKNRNKHNHLSIKTKNYITLDINKINCGKGTYGTINIEFYGNNNEGIMIGNYCSIAPDVQCILGGNHIYTNLSTFPFDTYYFNNREKSYSKGKIIIEDDVWIGKGATILSGVTLGKGCIVGAKAVVAKDVPPYAIVVGNPSEIIKYRFDDNIIKILKDLAYDKINLNNHELLYTTITSENAKNIIDILNKGD